MCRTAYEVLPGPIAMFLQGYVPVKIGSHGVTVGEPDETPSLIQPCPCILIHKVKGGWQGRTHTGKALTTAEYEELQDAGKIMRTSFRIQMLMRWEVTTGAKMFARRRETGQTD